MNHGHELKALDAMNKSRLWMISYFRSCDQGSECYEQLRVVDDMNDSRSHELKPLDSMNSSRLWMI